MLAAALAQRVAHGLPSSLAISSSIGISRSGAVGTSSPATPSSTIVPGRLSFLGAGIRSYISDYRLPAFIDVDVLDANELRASLAKPSQGFDLTYVGSQ